MIRSSVVRPGDVVEVVDEAARLLLLLERGLVAEADLVGQGFSDGTKREEGRGKRQEARGKRQEARGKRQEARGKRQERSHIFGKCRVPL